MAKPPVMKLFPEPLKAFLASLYGVCTILGKASPSIGWPIFNRIHPGLAWLSVSLCPINKWENPDRSWLSMDKGFFRCPGICSAYAICSPSGFCFVMAKKSFPSLFKGSLCFGPSPPCILNCKVKEMRILSHKGFSDISINLGHSS